MNSSACERLQWDSEFFGVKVARVIVGRCTPIDAKSILSWCEAESIDCLYLLCPFNDPRIMRVAEDNAFQMMDARVELEADIPAERSGSILAIRAARQADLQDLRLIARQAHRASRFYADYRFPRQLCDRLYETWIEKSCKGWADCVLVAEWEGCAAGYITCDSSGACGRIGLFAVGPNVQGRGLGSALLAGAFAWFREHEVKKVVVATQAGNVGAQRIYQLHGFRTRDVSLWYHRWFDRPDGGRA